MKTASNTPEYDRLKEVDWTFSSADTQGATHSLHPYPAKFIPQIPRTLIDVLHPRDGTAVLDPFCGSGTTLVEAALAGIPAVGIDLHPLAVLISKVKLSRPAKPVEAAAQEVLGRLKAGLKATPADIPALDHWFKEEVQLALGQLLQAIDLEADQVARDALRIAASSIIVRVSNQDSDTRYAAVEKQVSRELVLREFRKAAVEVGQALERTWGGFFETPPVDLINNDVLKVEPQEIRRPISLVITSPPYPNAYEYWLYHKYRMYWLGMDPLHVRAHEIGARPHFFRSKDPHTAEDFRRQMGGVFDLLAAVVIPGGHVCFQVGNSKIHGAIVDNGQILREVARDRGFDEVMILNREIPSNRTSFNPSHGRIRGERILIMRQPPE